MDQPPPNRRKKIVLYVSAGTVLAIIIVLLLLLRQCRGRGEPPFDYFVAKAAELGRDPARVAKFVREDVATLSYHGDVKGALATLWNGAGSPEEKQRLLEALLRHCPGAGPPVIEGADPNAPVCTLTITHRAKTETKIFEGPIGACVGDVHSIEYPKAGLTRFTIRAATPVTKDVETAGAMFEEVVFTVQRPGQEPFNETRELWHADNRVGLNSAETGDRHDFVVLPARITKYVREKEELVLKERGRENAPEASGYLDLLDYCLKSDGRLSDLEKRLGVRARFDLPRILILSRIPSRENALALDLRMNRTSFEGSPAASYLACETRSFVESGLEQHFLAKLAGGAATSAYNVFCRLKDDYPDTYDRRVKLAVQALDAIEETGGLDAKVTFRALSPAKDRKPLATVEATRDPDGALRVRGGPVNRDFARKLATAPGAPKIRYDGATLDEAFETPEEAAVAVEATLTAADTKPSVPYDYVLDARIDRGREPLVAPGATFEFAWGAGEDRTDQRIGVASCGVVLSFRWRVQTDARPATGLRTVGGKALAGSAVHNPWYVTGEDRQEDATSFCVSRRACEAMKAGRPFEFAIQGRLPPTIDPREKPPRPVEWKGSLISSGPGSARVRINGREETIPILKAKAGPFEIAILDDPTYPVGMADKLTSVTTSVRGRLVDLQGLGIENADIRLLGFEETATTAADGSFRLPPSRKIFGKVKLSVLHHGRSLGEPEVDLTAPGREEVVVKVDRKRPGIEWIDKENRDRLDQLVITRQVKRHARREIDAGRLVVIPDRMVELAGGTTIGYFALDPKTGDIAAVMENGLNGSTDELARKIVKKAEDKAREIAKEKIKDKVKEALKDKAKDLLKKKAEEEAEEGVSGFSGQVAVLQAYRGALVSAWVYSGYRVGGQSHEEVVDRMLDEMEDWEEATNLLSNVGKAAEEAAEKLMSGAGGNKGLGKKIREALAKKAGEKTEEAVEKLLEKLGVGGPISGDGAKISFYVGYLGALGFLNSKSGG